MDIFVIGIGAIDVIHQVNEYPQGTASDITKWFVLKFETLEDTKVLSVNL